jgi:PAS domain S-box-containing protein
VTISDERARLDTAAAQDAAIAQTLGSPERVAMLRVLANAASPLSPRELAAATGLDVAILALHLPVLLDADVVAPAESIANGDEQYSLAETPLACAVRTLVLATAPAGSAEPAGGVTHVVSETLDAILDQMASGVALYDASGVLVRLNPAGARITRRSLVPGETQDDRIRRYSMRRPDGTPMPVDESPSGRALRGEIVSHMECVIDGQHGPDTWLRCSATPLRNGAGVIEGAVVTFEDITEQRNLSREEARQRALAAAMIEHAFSGMAVFDASDDFRCLQHNDNFLHIMGPNFIARGTMVGMTLEEMFTGDTQAGMRATYERVRQTGEPFFSNEFSAILPFDAQRHWYRVRITPFRDERGKITGLLNVALEITELVKSRDVSEKHAAELRAIIEAMPQAVMLADSNGTFALTNAAASRILGHPFSPDDPRRQHTELLPVLAPDDRPLEVDELPLSRALNGETLMSQELRHRRPDGERIDLLASAAPVLFDDDGNVARAVLVFQEITRLKELERQRDDFLGIAAHELRTPLATILATLQAYLRRLAKNPGEQAIPLDTLTSGLERMLRQSQRLNLLVTDLLDATRIRTGSLAYDMEPCDLAQIVRDAVAGQEAANPDRRIARALPKQPLIVTGDVFRLAQVVDNLISNALKYSQDDLPVMVTLRAEHSMARLRVMDKGVGIPPENIEHLFDRFYRVPGIDVQSGGGVGLGLGLHIAHTIVERHGGRIEVRSIPGKGSTFIVSLPLAATPTPASL